MAEPNVRLKQALDSPLYKLIDLTWIDFDSQFTKVSITEKNILRLVLWCLEGLKDNSGDRLKHAEKMRTLLLRILREQYEQKSGEELNLLIDIIMSYVLESLEWAQTYDWVAFMGLYNEVRNAIPQQNETIFRYKAELNRKVFDSGLCNSLKSWVGNFLLNEVFFTDEDANWAVTDEPEKKELELQTKPRELMTFKMGRGLLPAHLQLLYSELYTDGWIDGNWPDFERLFSGELQDFTLVWKGTYGQSTLVYLFNQIKKADIIELPKGYSLSAILDGHFTDPNGNRLKGLDKGGDPAKKARPFIDKYLKTLRTKVSGTDADDYNNHYSGGVYDSYDHQDLHLRKK